MASVNKVILLGNCGADPEIRTTAGGALVANVRIATSEKFKDREGQQQEKTEWHTLVFWGKLAEIVEKYVTRGKSIYVEGSIQSRSWDKPDGSKGYATEINVRELQLLGGGDRGGSEERAPAPAHAPRPSAAPAQRPSQPTFADEVPF